MPPRWKPPLASVIGACVVLAVGFVVKIALQPAPASIAQDSSKRVPVDPERFLVSRHFHGALKVSPGSVRDMIQYMHNAEIEIATQRAALGIERDPFLEPSHDRDRFQLIQEKR